MCEHAARIFVHGHRGARAARPENTLDAFAYAIAAGADAIELDVAVTRDDVLVVSHDPVLAPCGAVIRDTARDALPAAIPTLEQVFTLAAPVQVELNVELKSYPHAPQYTPAPAGFAALVLALVRAFRMESRAMLQSFDFRVLRALREQAPEIRRGALFEDDPRDFLAVARDAGGVHYVAPRHSLVTSAKVRRAHAAGIQVVPWTVNSPAAWQRMADCRVDAIITDDPASLIAWLRSR